MSKTLAAALAAAAVVILALGALAHADEVKIGVGEVGPISPNAVYEIEQLVAALPNVHEVPIVPPGDVDECVKRFVAGEPDDKLDGLMVVSLPTDAMKESQGANEAVFTGTYEIWVLNLSTLAEDRHTFTFEDREPVVSGVAAILAVPAQLLSERTGQGRLIAGNVWQAYQSVQARVEGKLVAATKLYLATSPIKQIGPLDPLECAQALVDRGDADTAMAVFKSAGVNNPRVQQMIASAKQQLERAQSQRLLGRTLGAIAGDNPEQAGVILAAYEKTSAAQRSRADAIRAAIAGSPPPVSRSRYHSILASDVPGLDHAAFVAMMTELFHDQTGSAPNEIIVSSSEVRVEDKDAPAGLKTRLDAYARALGQSAWLMSLKCGCAASAVLSGEVAGPALLRARFEPSFKQPQVGLP